jgi:hypothetical protein
MHSLQKHRTIDINLLPFHNSGLFLIFLHSSVSVHGTAFKAVPKRLKLQVQERNAARPIVVAEVAGADMARCME